MPIEITTELIEQLRAEGVVIYTSDPDKQNALEYALIDAAAEALALRRILKEIDDWLWSAPVWVEKTRTYQEAMEEAKK